MIKIIQAYYLKQKMLRLHFSDNSFGDYDLQPLVDRDAELVLPLKDDDYFKQFFLELGALCWRNGLELCPDSIHQKLAEKHQLHYECTSGLTKEKHDKQSWLQFYDDFKRS